MNKLSPASQAVWNAFLDRYEWTVTTEELFAVAAALRAAADQVVPLALCVHNDDFVYVRHQLHAIADELEAQ